MDELRADDQLVKLFAEWLAAFEAGEAKKPVPSLAGIESLIETTPAEGLLGLVVKLGLHLFLIDHADTANGQVTSAVT